MQKPGFGLVSSILNVTLEFLPKLQGCSDWACTNSHNILNYTYHSFISVYDAYIPKPELHFETSEPSLLTSVWGPIG